MSPWTPIASGLWLGRAQRPFRDEFDSVLVLTTEANVRNGHLRIRHLPPPQHDAELQAFLDAAVAWVVRRWQPDAKVLVQADDPYWSDLVVAATFMHLGASLDEAIVPLRHARPEAFAEQRYLDQLVGPLREREVPS